jgi:hypothetical protein
MWTSSGDLRWRREEDGFGKRTNPRGRQPEGDSRRSEAGELDSSTRGDQWHRLISTMDDRQHRLSTMDDRQHRLSTMDDRQHRLSIKLLRCRTIILRMIHFRTGRRIVR